MQHAAQALTNPPARAGNADISIRSVLTILWAVFAFTVAAALVIDPGLFDKQDPDSQLRLVQVRDFLAGQGWFDLVQHRMNPPEGTSMHWSRLIDAPLAGLVLLGNALFGYGEPFALAIWPLVLLFAFMGGVAHIATTLGGRSAAVLSLFLSLFFFTPLLEFMPGSIDHHNAQLALMVAAIAAALRIRNSAWAGAAAGGAAALSLAIGLEMLPFLGLLAGAVALSWAWTGDGGRGTALFGASFAIASALLFLLSAPPSTWWACDSISLPYVLPAGVGGFGLAVVAAAEGRVGFGGRLAAGALLAAASLASLAWTAPHCLSGPLGGVSAELDRLWLSTVSEAQPLAVYFLKEPSSAIANASPPLLALALTLRRLRRERQRTLLITFAALLAAPVALSFWQLRTLPLANALAIPALAAWIGSVAARQATAKAAPLRRMAPTVLAFVAAVPLVHLGGAMAGEEAVAILSGGRIAVHKRADAPTSATAHLSKAEKDCLDSASAALLAQVPEGLVLAPLFYGSAVLKISGHAVVAGPYHRIGDAIIENIQTLHATPKAARAVLEKRAVRYVALCTTSQEVALTRTEGPHGLLATLMNGQAVGWLEPVAPRAQTTLRLWRVRD